MEHGNVHRSNKEKKSSVASNQTCDSGPRDGDAPHDLWDTLESDTESLVQEKAYQRELQERILNSAGGSISSSNDVEKWEHEEGCDPQPDVTEPREDQHTNLSRRMPSWDDYADLRYDPDWRKKLQGSEFFQTDLSSDLTAPLRQAGHAVYPKGNNEYLLVHSPVLSETGGVHPKPPQSSFHLHPTEDPVPALPLPQGPPASSESTPRSNSEQSKNAKRRIDHQRSAAGIPPFSSQQDGENRRISPDPDRDELLVAAAMQRRRDEKVRPTRLRDDIVERNKATLGRNVHKQGSYLKVYEKRGAKPDEEKRPLQSDEDTASTDSAAGSPDNALNPELMWIQKTQKLKTRNQSKRLDRTQPQHHRTEPRVRVEKQPAEKQRLDPGSGPHWSFSSAPTVNINPNATTTLAEPLTSVEPRKQPYALALPPPPQWGIRNDEYNAPFKGLSYTVSISGPSAATVDREGKQVTRNSIRISPTQTPFQEGFTLNTPQPGGVHYGVDPAVVLQTHHGAYPVLPPIGGSNNSDPELCSGSGRQEESLTTIHRSSSEGYLAQLEKQKQIQAKTNYKAYTLKDYRSLNRDVKLGGLGPSNIVANDVAEKIRQQKLYSDVIREQNKKISRIPSLPTRSPVGRDNKDIIPRNKALEYAKTIAKPKAPPPALKERSGDKPESERAFQHSASPPKVDLDTLSTIEVLRKRHEQEKQAVASFTNIHGKSTAPSINSH